MDVFFPWPKKFTDQVEAANAVVVLTLAWKVSQLWLVNLTGNYSSGKQFPQFLPRWYLIKRGGSLASYDGAIWPALEMLLLCDRWVKHTPFKCMHGSFCHQIFLSGFSPQKIDIFCCPTTTKAAATATTEKDEEAKGGPGEQYLQWMDVMKMDLWEVNSEVLVEWEQLKIPKILTQAWTYCLNYIYCLEGAKCWIFSWFVFWVFGFIFGLHASFLGTALGAMWAVGDDMDVEATGRWRHSSWPVLVGDSGSYQVKMVSSRSFALPVMS